MRTTPSRHRWTRSALAAGALGVAALLTLSACSNDTSGGNSEDANAITVYNAQHESLTQEWVDEFTAETGITVNLRNGGDTEMANQLIAEGDRSPADVFLTENSPAMAAVENAGLFADVAPDTLAQVPEQYRPSTGKWTGIAARSTVFVYNTEALTPDRLPKSLLDLQNPEWKGRWAASPSGADFQAIVAALLELRGEDATRAWLDAMKAGSVPYKGNTAVLKAVNAGEIDGGVIYHYYWFGDQAKGGENSSNTQLHYFRNEDPGAFVSVSGGGVLAASTHQQQAQAFLKFITGKKGQEILQTGTSFEYPVGSDVAANPALVPLVELQAPPVDPSTLDSAKVTQMMTDAGLI
ncbi:iron ABC transporter substrate-binding protein [Rhodococcus sp. NPDC003382]|uniref:iron ABC transporter substrate-binding protein n=1 Tax=unclassified Rhodococcus (in: high G+C Gram-positive bacteria) TaxID=192944 RepID=UPI0018CFBF1D|nr:MULTISPECIES: iron ABC transporter substrate-binding protein [unclassified Rhodococcus (in: high G+C Gram-positive bacteria)]MBH0122153.1 iron ABC transporter substrate-binding protein [Rhodococcus sp. CX]MCK8669634.1 iron ABC transporter substrate-binding protein [Rhodococcus sp. HM1]